MKPLTIIALFIVACVVTTLFLVVLVRVPTFSAAQAALVDQAALAQQAPLAEQESFAVPLSGATAGRSGAAAPGVEAALQAYPGLDQFATSVMNGQPGDVVGVYVRDIMALPVEQQPSGLPDYVASEHNLLTEFQMPKRFGSVGILAHNYLSGSRFTQLSEGTEIVLVFGDGRVTRYAVKDIDLYQALEPNSPVSDFVHPNDPTRQVMTSGELFERMYTTPNQLVFQTCVEAFGDPSWGRMFVTAEEIQQNGTVNFTVPQLSLPGLN